MLRNWRFLTLLLAALGLIMGGAHVLELPPKMQAYRYTRVWAREAGGDWRVVGGHVSGVPGDERG